MPRGIARALISFMMLAALLVALVGAAFLAYNVYYAGRIFAGVSIQGVQVGGLYPAQAWQRLHAALDGACYPYIRLHSSEGEWTLSTRDLGARIDLEEAVRRAFLLGRRGVFREDMIARLKLLWWGYRIVPPFYLEPGEALVPLRSVAREAGHPARKAQLWVAGLQAQTDTSQVGREMDVEATRQAIERAVQDALGDSGWAERPRILNIFDLSEAYVRAELPSAVGSSPFPIEPIAVQVAFREIVPPITEVEGGRERAEQILAGPVEVFFVFPEIAPDGGEVPLLRRWAADRAMLNTWLTVHREETPSGTRMVVDVERTEISRWLAELALEIERAPRDGRFDYDPGTGQVRVVAPGQNGYALDLPLATERVAAACFASADGQGRVVELPVHVIPPRVTYAELAAMAPLALLGEGESRFAGSTAERLQNIKTASSRFHGVAVPADGVFSFLAHLGMVTTANGYSESWVIYGDRTVLGPGGGVCQVSTTCFRAAFWAGLPIVERWPHSYRVGWYEPPLGLDAAVFHPTTDMKFRNDTGAPLLILTEVNEAEGRLIFRLYGRATGCKVTLEGPETGEPTPPGDPVFEEDPTLPVGTRILVERAREGVDVTLYRIIEVNGRKGEREPFVSHYKPWPARYKVGTKTE
ncbi:MAG: VanW family protein [Chloroflexi bacterium]|nr:VanW family protein [Chloroflexota bacterium]